MQDWRLPSDCNITLSFMRTNIIYILKTAPSNNTFWFPLSSETKSGSCCFSSVKLWELGEIPKPLFYVASWIVIFHKEWICCTNTMSNPAVNSLSSPQKHSLEILCLCSPPDPAAESALWDRSWDFQPKAENGQFLPMCSWALFGLSPILWFDFFNYLELKK